jgi:hypothetical protein
MIAPASEKVAQQFGTTNPVLIAMTTSVFVLAYGEDPALRSVAYLLPTMTQLSFWTTGEHLALFKCSFEIDLLVLPMIVLGTTK